MTISGLPQVSPGLRSPQTTKTVLIPAPNGGINVLDMLVATPQEDSILQYNLIPSYYGTRVRTGITQWAQQLGAGANVRTIIPYNGSTSANDKLFAAGQLGIYDISVFGANNPAAAIAFGTADTTSGLGGSVAFATLAGNFIAYCDESNGYYTFTQGTGWLKVTLGGGATQVTPPDPATLVWPCSFKTRLWFVQKNTATAWYTASGALYGTLTQFNFGDKFRHGGFLVGLYTWTLDGGVGIDDYLVAVSSSGDVLVYQGTDPSVATSFSLVGQWYIGPPPAGRRITGSFGGDLYILSSYGLLPLSKLISGILIQSEQEYLTRKVSPIINTLMASGRLSLGWEVKVVPSENLILIGTPLQVPAASQQLVQNLNTQGWAFYRNLPYFTGDAWNGAFYIGDQTGHVYLHTGNTDLGVAVNFSLLTSYQEYQEVGNYHRIQFVRPVFLAAVSPQYAITAKYDYDLSEALAPTAGALPPNPAWDIALWDIALWGGTYVTFAPVVGTGGMGRAMALAMNGQSTTDTILLRFDMMFDTGGYL